MGRHFVRDVTPVRSRDCIRQSEVQIAFVSQKYRLHSPVRITDCIRRKEMESGYFTSWFTKVSRPFPFSGSALKIISRLIHGTGSK